MEAQDNSTRLRDVIKAIRACKTAAEEHAVISEESARIRSSFRLVQSDNRHRNVAKLIFFHMLGYPTAFGHIECLKLIVSKNMSEKKVGYLALCQLMGEEDELTLMAVSSIKADLASERPAIVNTALAAVANTASADMCRELATDVLGLLGKSKSSVMPRAALAACRVVTKCPELLEDYLPIATTFVDERNTQLLGTGLSLIITILKLDPSRAHHFATFSAALQSALRELVMRDSSEELDINNITDPFTQCRLLEVLRLTGRAVKQDKADLEETLAYVLTSTEYAKQTGRCVLYECCRTILDINSSLQLRDQALSMLGKLLLSRENNTRFIALKGMAKEAGRPGALQSYLRSVMECVQDPDWAVAKRALDLMAEMTNRDNVRQVTSDLLSLLITADSELKDSIAVKISMLAELHSLDQRGYIDTIVRVLSLSALDEDTVCRTANIVLNSSQLHEYAVKMLFLAARENIGQEGLVNLALWCVGEYADLLVSENREIEVETPSTSEVLDFFKRVLEKDSLSVRLYAVTAIAKTALRLPAEEAAWRFLLEEQKTNKWLEVQQRVCEYLACMDIGELKETVFRPQPSFQTEKKAAVLETPMGGLDASSPKTWEFSVQPLLDSSSPTWAADLLSTQPAVISQLPDQSLNLLSDTEVLPSTLGTGNLLDWGFDQSQKSMDLGGLVFGEIASPSDDFSELPSLEIYSDAHLCLSLTSSNTPSATLLDITAKAKEGPLQELNLTPVSLEELEEITPLSGVLQAEDQMQGSWRTSNSKHLDLRFSLRYLFQEQLICAEVSIPNL